MKFPENTPYDGKSLKNLISVKESRAETENVNKEMKEEILAKLERTKGDIEQVEGKMSDNISTVFDNINNAEDKHTASIATLTIAIDSMEKKVEAILQSVPACE